jgi:hypothetical protein
VLSDIARAVRGMPDGTAVLLAGCEPFAHPELVPIVTGAIAAGVERLGLRTDARALGRGQNARGAVSHGVRWIDVPVLGGSGELHDALAATSGAFAAAIGGMEAFLQAGRETGVPVVLSGYVPVCGHNVADLSASVAAFVRGGATSVRLDVDAATAASAGTPARIEAAIETGVVNGVWVSVSGIAADALPGHGLHLLAPVELRSLEP